jgi:hypothetical protein
MCVPLGWQLRSTTAEVAGWAGVAALLPSAASAAGRPAVLGAHSLPKLASQHTGTCTYITTHIHTCVVLARRAGRPVKTAAPSCTKLLPARLVPLARSLALCLWCMQQTGSALAPPRPSHWLGRGRAYIERSAPRPAGRGRMSCKALKRCKGVPSSRPLAPLALQDTFCGTCVRRPWQGSPGLGRPALHPCNWSV